MKDKILKMLEALRPEADYKNCTNFVEIGLLDSFDVVSLMAQLEKEYSIKIDSMDVLPENFVSLDAIAALVLKSGGKA